jgi:hypothetical protein
MISKRRASTDRQRGAIDLSAKALVPAAQLLISGSRPIDAPGRVFFLDHLATGPEIWATRRPIHDRHSCTSLTQCVIETGVARPRFEKGRVESPLSDHLEPEVAPLCSSRVAPLACIGIGQLRRIRTLGKRSADLTWRVRRR